MKWGEFKKKVEEQGVKDEDDLWYIDCQWDISEDVKAVVTDHTLGWKIT